MDEITNFHEDYGKPLEDRDLSLKQRKWLLAYLESGNATAAAQAAGYKATSRASFAQIGHDNLKRLRPTIDEMMDRMGLDNGALVRRLRDGLDAMAVQTASHQGVITDERAYIDFPTRAKYLDMALRLRAAYPSEKAAAETGPQALDMLRGLLAQRAPAELPEGADDVQ